jgi:4-carboxymuconolactone decarboxylase
MTPTPSKTLTELYGEAYAKEVLTRLESLDPELSQIIQDIPYDKFWSRNHLSIRDKSIATIAALVALGREEQTAIHMRGFLHSGGSHDDLRNLLIHLAIYCGFPAAMAGFATLKKVKESL